MPGPIDDSFLDQETISSDEEIPDMAASTAPPIIETQEMNKSPGALDDDWLNRSELSDSDIEMSGPAAGPHKPTNAKKITKSKPSTSSSGSKLIGPAEGPKVRFDPKGSIKVVLPAAPQSSVAPSSSLLPAKPVATPMSSAQVVEPPAVPQATGAL